MLQKCGIVRAICEGRQCFNFLPFSSSICIWNQRINDARRARVPLSRFYRWLKSIIHFYIVVGAERNRPIQETKWPNDLFRVEPLLTTSLDDAMFRKTCKTKKFILRASSIFFSHLFLNHLLIFKNFEPLQKYIKVTPQWLIFDIKNWFVWFADSDPYIRS